MKNKEIEELLNELKWYADAPNEQDYNGEYDPPLEWEQGEVKLLLSYIEQLNLENKFAKEYEKNYRETYKKYKQLENNRDKAIEICDFYNKKYQKDPLGNQKVLFVISNVMNVLKGDSDDK